MSEFKLRVAAALREMKRRRGLRNQDVAERSGLGVRTVAGAFSGEREQGGENMDRICAALDCSVAQLLSLAASMDVEK